MKIIGFIFLLLLSITGEMVAQKSVSFREDFNDNSYGWSNTDGADLKTEFLSGGLYSIQHKRLEGAYDVYKQVYINQNKPWEMTTRIKQVDGVDNYGYGLLFGMKDVNNTFTFLITSNGNFKVNELKKGEYSDISPWKVHSAIKPMGEWNVLKIVNKGGYTQFYINDEKVFVSFQIPLKGNSLGFNMNQSMKIIVDYVELKQDGNIIKIAPGYTGDDIKLENLGANVNWKGSDKSPVISPDGKYLYTGRADHPQNTGSDKSKDDIWVSEHLADGKFGPIKNIGPPLNNAGHNGVATAMPDNNTLILTNTYKADGETMGSGISITRRTENGWEMPKEIKIDNYYNNHKYAEYWMSGEQNVLFMSIERDETEGDKDIYYSLRKADGTYTEPKNCGPIINTFVAENSPYLASDGKTLFFSTSGYPNYGANDIFMSKRLDDTYEHWSEPMNLGPKINSHKWDAYFRMDAKGEYAYLVSQENAIGEEDVFQVKIKEPEAKPEPVALVKGKVLDSKTKKPIGTSVHIQDLLTGKEIGVANSNPKDGSYQIVLPFGKKYSFQAKAPDHFGTNQNLDLSVVTQYTEYKKDLLLTPVEKGASIRLENIFFDPGKSVLRRESFAELDRLVELLKDNPKLSIRIEGHTEIGTHKDALLKLSNERAKACLNYITSKGLAASRISSKGFGDQKPLSTANTEEGKQLNRRVEFVIL